MDPHDFIPICPHTVVWQPLAGRDKYGKPIYGQAQMFPGRRVFKYSRVAAFSRGVKGEGADAISESQIWILPVDAVSGNDVSPPSIGYEDLVYVQGDDTTKFLPPVLSVQTNPDAHGVLFTKVYLGSANG